MEGKTWTMTEEVWLYPSETAAWHFVSVPRAAASEIRERFGKRARGFGSLPVRVTIGRTTFATSIFPDNRSATYLLPLKALVRSREGIRAGERVTVTFTVIPPRNTSHS